MQEIPRLVLDTFCEVYDLLEPYATSSFWNLDEHEIIPGATYLIGRQQFETHIPQIRDWASRGVIRVILSNPAEGSQTLAGHCQLYGVTDLVKSGKILLISGGDMDDSWPHVQFDGFLPKILDYEENLAAMSRSDEIYQVDKPYKFLFLNGRSRSHRRWLLDRWRDSGLLHDSLWTCLDTRMGKLQYLPGRYEYEPYQKNIGQTSGPPDAKDRIAKQRFVKHDLFNNQWGEIYINPLAYIDTYFSIVTETVFDYPHSFRTEKIWKPVVMGHPWIAVANRGYYRDLHALGFKSFGALIDESFDSIEDNEKRLVGIAEIVEDICRQDLDQFVIAAKDICKNNQQHYQEMRSLVRTEFPQKFFRFLKQHG
jgi:hypothetical protein